MMYSFLPRNSFENVTAFRAILRVSKWVNVFHAVGYIWFKHDQWHPFGKCLQEVLGSFLYLRVKQVGVLSGLFGLGKRILLIRILLRVMYCDGERENSLFEMSGE